MLCAFPEGDKHIGGNFFHVLTTHAALQNALYDSSYIVAISINEPSQRLLMSLESRALAKYMWASLDTEHSRGYAATRCWIPGKRKLFIRCPDTASCANCPHKEDKQPPVISWDELVETGYEPAASASPEESTMTKSEYEIIKAAMDAEDIRIAKAFEMKELFGFSVREIAAEFQLSEPRVYQLIARAKAIGREYRQENG